MPRRWPDPDVPGGDTYRDYPHVTVTRTAVKAIHMDVVGVGDDVRALGSHQARPGPTI